MEAINKMTIMVMTMTETLVRTTQKSIMKKTMMMMTTTNPSVIFLIKRN